MVAACGGNTPAASRKQSGAIQIFRDASTTTTTTLPAPTAAEESFFQDILNLSSTEKAVTASLTTTQANQTTGTAYTAQEVSADVAPVTTALRTAINDLTQLIPSLPANSTTYAQSLSSALSSALEGYQVDTQIALSSAGASYLDAAEQSADVEVEIAELQGDVTIEGALISPPEREFILTMGTDYDMK